jgi:hypothetical protein
MGTRLKAYDVGEIQNFSEEVKGADHLVWVDRKEIRWSGEARFHRNDPSVPTKSRQSLD